MIAYKDIFHTLYTSITFGTNKVEEGYNKVSETPLLRKAQMTE